MKKWIRFMSIAAAVSCVAPALAQVEQKEALLRRLLNDSPAIARIAASDDAEAKDYFRLAGERHANAVALMKAADPARAEAELNEAMWMVGKARQRVPDPMLREIELRVQNAAMTRAIDSLRASYTKHLARARGAPSGASVSDPALKRITEQIDEARSLANSENVKEANTVLHAAEHDLMVALGQVLGATTLEYAQRFETLAEEYAHESARLRSYEELIPIALSELRPGREAVALMERYAGRARALSGRAEKSAAGREFRAAIDNARKATSYLQGALTAAGLTLPADAAPLSTAGAQ